MSNAELLANLNHLINSPLAAIRYALYLAASRSADSDIQRYLKMADEEVTFIAQSLKDALAANRSASDVVELPVVAQRARAGRAA